MYKIEILHKEQAIKLSVDDETNNKDVIFKLVDDIREATREFLSGWKFWMIIPAMSAEATPFSLAPAEISAKLWVALGLNNIVMQAEQTDANSLEIAKIFADIYRKIGIPVTVVLTEADALKALSAD